MYVWDIQLELMNEISAQWKLFFCSIRRWGWRFLKEIYSYSMCYTMVSFGTPFYLLYKQCTWICNRISFWVTKMQIGSPKIRYDNLPGAKAMVLCLMKRLITYQTWEENVVIMARQPSSTKASLLSRFRDHACYDFPDEWSTRRRYICARRDSNPKSQRVVADLRFRPRGHRD
jgi:hypothetical protein